MQIKFIVQCCQCGEDIEVSSTDSTDGEFKLFVQPCKECLHIKTVDHNDL